MKNEPKVEGLHLSRRAYVYVRQSTEHQVLHHLESRERQYELVELAKTLGWSEDSIEVIDEDLGRSASSTHGRTGFESLVSNVALGNAGIVIGIEVSRLARNNRDWYQLLELCSVTSTLIADAEGVYDPGSFNDRLLLGLKGTMSEAELHLIKSRMLAGLYHKAEKGELRFHLPPGYCFDEEGGIVKSSNEQIVHLIELIFSKYFEIGTVAGLVKYMLHEGLKFPRKSAYDSTPRWVAPYYRGVYTMLLNPIYSGTYVYGKTKMVKELDERGNQRTRQKRLPMKHWRVVIHDHHPAYISWDDYLRITKMVEQNRPARQNEAARMIREGAALLQGMVRCGRCGRSMRVRYQSHGHGKRDKAYAYYVCNIPKEHGGRGVCQSMGGRRIDAALSRTFLEEMSPARTEIHLTALRKIMTKEDEVIEQLELSLERARYEANRIERQYNQVEPENRVVARTLESRWNAALEDVDEIDRRIRERRRSGEQPLTREEEKRLRELAHDLEKLWNGSSVNDKDRKRLLRAAIEEVQLIKRDRTVSMKIIWKGGASTSQTVDLPRLPQPTASPPNLIELLRELAGRHTDDQIARTFNRRNIKTPKGLSFDARRVANVRNAHNIPVYKPPRETNQRTYTVEQAARRLGVSAPTVYLWLRDGLLKGDQITSGAPWAIEITDDDLKRLTSNQVPKGWLSAKDLAEVLGVTKQTVLNWVKANKLEYVYARNGRRRGLRINPDSAPYANQPRLPI